MAQNALLKSGPPKWCFSTSGVDPHCRLCARLIDEPKTWPSRPGGHSGLLVSCTPTRRAIARAVSASPRATSPGRRRQPPQPSTPVPPSQRSSTPKQELLHQQQNGLVPPPPPASLDQLSALVPTISLDDILSGKPLPPDAFSSTTTAGDSTPGGSGSGDPQAGHPAAKTTAPLRRRAPLPWDSTPPPPSASPRTVTAPLTEPAPSLPGGSYCVPASSDPAGATADAGASGDSDALLPRPRRPRPQVFSSRRPPQSLSHGRCPSPARDTPAAAPAGSARPTTALADALGLRRQPSVGSEGSQDSAEPMAAGTAVSGAAGLGKGQTLLPHLAAPPAAAPANAAVRSTRVPRAQRVRSPEWIEARKNVELAAAEAVATAASCRVYDVYEELSMADWSPDAGGLVSCRGSGEAAASPRAPPGPPRLAAVLGSLQGQPPWARDVDEISEPRGLLVVPEAQLRSALDAAAVDQRLGSVGSGLLRQHAAVAGAAAAATTFMSPEDLPDTVDCTTWPLHAAVLFPDLYDSEWHGCLFDFLFELWPEVGRAHVAVGGTTGQQQRLLVTDAELAAAVALESGAAPPPPPPLSRRERAAGLLDAAYRFAAACAESPDFAVRSALVVSVLDCLDDHDALIEQLPARLPAAVVLELLVPLAPRFQPEWVVEDWMAAVRVAHPDVSPSLGTSLPRSWMELVGKLEAAQAVHHGTSLAVLHTVLHFDDWPEQERERGRRRQPDAQHAAMQKRWRTRRQHTQTKETSVGVPAATAVHSSLGESTEVSHTEVAVAPSVSHTEVAVAPSAAAAAAAETIAEPPLGAGSTRKDVEGWQQQRQLHEEEEQEEPRRGRRRPLRGQERLTASADGCPEAETKAGGVTGGVVDSSSGSNGTSPLESSAELLDGSEGSKRRRGGSKGGRAVLTGQEGTGGARQDAAEAEDEEDETEPQPGLQRRRRRQQTRSSSSSSSSSKPPIAEAAPGGEVEAGEVEDLRAAKADAGGRAGAVGPPLEHVPKGFATLGRGRAPGRGRRQVAGCLS